MLIENKQAKTTRSHCPYSPYYEPAEMHLRKCISRLTYFVTNRIPKKGIWLVFRQPNHCWKVLMQLLSHFCNRT